ncbi:putative zinc-binding metallopeptidase, partial [Verrucomicrobiota bacterium]
GDKTSCMKLLRHETGHALNYAHSLHRRKRWKELFGSFATDYPERYRYRPYSKRFVRHLDEWYAQYHPDEDFAETFAVWLNPRSNWRKTYKGWKALAKLEYVNQLMQEIGTKPPKKTVGQKHWDISKMKTTLNTYYKRKRESSAEYYPDFHDFHLNIIFQKEEPDSGTKAHQIIKRYRKTILDYVSFWTGEKKYVINGILKGLADRCRELGLYANTNENDTLMKITTYVTSLTMNYLYTGRFKKVKK